MNAKNVYFGLIIVTVLLAASFAWGLYTADGLLQGQSHALVTAKTQNKIALQRQTLLAQDKKDLSTYAVLNTIAKSVVPQDKDQAEAVREIVNLAAQSGIPQLSAITFDTSTLGTSTQVKTTNGLTQVAPVKGIPGVYSLQITITQAPTQLVPYSNFITFLGKIEQNRRTAQVTSINVQPDQKNPSLTSFTLVISEFIKP